ncbi:MAG: hypothetical protein JKY56_03175 [Kofleriaceae bacterium]|nr:hypothetical protein [Kofleriaceae bacterium]
MNCYRAKSRGLLLTTLFVVSWSIPVFAQSVPSSPDIGESDVASPDAGKSATDTQIVAGSSADSSQSLPALELLSASDVAEAPAPEASSGIDIEERTGLGSKLLWVPRVVFYVPNQLLRLAFVPLQGMSYVWGRYRLPERFHDVFFNASGTFGIVPVAFVDTGFGLNAGVRLLHSDIFGEHESITLRASFGGRFDQFYSFAVDSGQRFGRISLGLRGGFERGSREPFYGIGNADEVKRESIIAPINASDRSTAVQTRFKQDLSYIKAWSSYRLTRAVKLKVSSELRVQRFREDDDDLDDDDDTFDFFDPNSLVSLQDGTQGVYTQLQLSFDNRQNVDRYVDTVIGPGLYAAAWLGYAKGFDDDPSNHFRYAVDVQGVINLWRGDRLLVLRGLVDGVTAKLDEIPFTDLPELGGAKLLRGYAGDRFRDRLHTLASAEYQFNLTDKNTAFYFVDTGRVWRKWLDLELEGFRTGFGGGIIFQTGSSFVARVQLATSTDGGFFFNFALDPVYQPQRREELR